MFGASVVLLLLSNQVGPAEGEERLDEVLQTLECNLDRFLEAAQRGRHRMHERSSKESVVAPRAA